MTDTSDWTWEDDYAWAWLPTDDPRLFVVIERDQDAQAPWGDALLPAYQVEYRSDYTTSRVGDVYHDGESDYLARRYFEARAHFRSEEMLERWLRIFHNASALLGSYGYGNDFNVLLMDTPGWREHVGITSDTPMSEADLKEHAAEWEAYADGDVFGIGYGVIENRVMPDSEVEAFEMERTISVWGYYGETYAKWEALGFPDGKPDLHPLLDLGVTA